MSDPMRHNRPGFWQYAVAYILFGAGAILIVLELLEFALGDRRLNLGLGLLACFMGFLVLAAVKKRGDSA